MKRLKKLFIMMMSLTVFLSLAYTQVCAYGYKVTLYTGNQGTINSPHTIQYQNLVLSLDGYTVKVDEKSFMLTQKEFELLRELLTHQGQVLTRQSLLNKIWKYDFYGDERVVDTHIKNLRKKLDINFIQTVRGVGYKID